MSEPTPNPEIRRTIHNNEWWFVITDVVGALTDSVDPSDYLKKMRKRDPELAAVRSAPQPAVLRRNRQSIGVASTDVRLVIVPT